MGEQRFHDLVQEKLTLQATELAEKNAQKNTTFDFVQMQQQEEEQYYNELAHKPGEMVELVSRSRGETLAPRLDEKGLSDKRKEKLRRRTVSSFEKGKKTVGEYATAQTIPLMKSIKKNKAVIDKQREKERTDIVALANLVLPVDIFDTNLTEKHTHFDVKKALKIKDALNRISEFKLTRGCEYELLDYEVILKLENLLAHKPAFDSTLRTVLAANGLSMDGEPLKDEEKIKEAREAFEPSLVAYKEMAGGFLDNATQVRITEANKVRRAIGTLASFQHKRQKTRDDMLGKESPKIIVDGVEQDAWAKWREIKESQAFLQSEFFNRSCYRLKEDKDGQSFDDHNYEMILMDYNAWKLSQKDWTGPEDRDEAFEDYKQKLVPYYKEYLQRSKALCNKIRGNGYWAMLARYEELVEIEMQGQHLNDLLKVEKVPGNKETNIKEAVGLSGSEIAEIAIVQEYLSQVRKSIDQVEVLKALNAGMELKREDVSSSIYKKFGNLLDERGVFKIDEFRSELAYNTAGALAGFKTIDAKEIARYDKTEEMSKRLKERGTVEIERQTDVVAYTEYIEKHGGYIDVFRAKREERKKPVKTRLMGLKWFFDNSRLAQAYMKGGDEEAVKGQTKERDEAFLYMLRELLGGSAITKYNHRTSVDLDESCFKSREITGLLADFSDANFLKFAEPLVNFKPDSYYSRFKKERIKDPKARLESVAQTMVDCQKVLELKQFFVRVVKPAGVLSEDTMKQIEKSIVLFDAFSETISSIGNKSMDEPTPTEINRWLLPDIATKAECTIRSQEIQDVRSEAEVSQIKFNPMDTMNVSIMTDKFKKLSLVDEKGRRRITFESNAEELIKYGKQDLIYYKELVLYADELLSHGEKSIKKQYKNDAEDIIMNCKKVKALYTQLQNKFMNPSLDVMSMIVEYEKETDEFYEKLLLSREEQSREYHKDKVERLRKEAGAFDLASGMLKREFKSDPLPA
ncbi:MAG: hypothetical protein IJL07_04200 [Lachnospiraceae bacterium]|nr:hypothetical protein [Lachnospiraceae bacterium]